MHQGARRAVARFHFDNRDYLDRVRIADLGSLNINGGVKDVIPGVIGFDIVDGPGVDVVIEPGVIPDDHKKQYGAVISSSSFTYCPDPFLYKRQIVDLLAPGGLLLLVMCSVECRLRHTSSDNEYKFGDEFRMNFEQVKKFFSGEFDILELGEHNYDHPDYVLVARLRG